MTQIDVLKMAIEAGLAAETSEGIHMIWYPDNLHHFANLVAAKEREACARLCEEHPDGMNMLGGAYVACAQAIRARGEQA